MLFRSTPSTTVERTIENILTNSGIKASDIQFRDDNRYLRIGYWKQLDKVVLDQLGDLVIREQSHYDDDCGWLFHYDVRQ